MWQNWKLKSESSPLGNVKHRHLPVEVLPAPTAALHGAAGQEASARPPPAGATASLPARPASRPDPKPAVQAAAREGNSSGRQAGSCHGDPRCCAHGSSWLPAEGLEPPSPSRATGALLQRRLLTSRLRHLLGILTASQPSHQPGDCPCGAPSSQPQCLPEGPLLPLSRRGWLPCAGSGGGHSIQPTARGHVVRGQGKAGARAGQ